MSFSEQLQQATLKIVDHADDARRAITLELFNSVITATPVDTGRARGNWQTTNHVPASGTLERIDPGGNLAKDEALQRVGASDPDGTVWLTNNLPYIMALEYGHSQRQAPEGMVRKSLARITQILREQARK